MQIVVLVYWCGFSVQLVIVCFILFKVFDMFKVVLFSDLCIKVDVIIICEYFVKQFEGLIKLICIVGFIVGIIMVIGVVFGVFNIMFVVVVVCVWEIVMLCVIGFCGVLVVVLVLLEMMLLVLFGGLFGGFVIWLIFNGYIVFMLGLNFSQVVFQFKVLLQLLWIGIKWVMVIGFIGGLFFVVCVVCLLVIIVLCEF